MNMNMNVNKNNQNKTVLHSSTKTKTCVKTDEVYNIAKIIVHFCSDYVKRKYVHLLTVKLFHIILTCLLLYKNMFLQQNKITKLLHKCLI